MQNRITPKKSLSQNFLNDIHIARKIALSLRANIGDVVVEIGPGTGALTKHLLDKKLRVVALEIDERAVKSLHSTFPASVYPLLHIVHGDALHYNLALLTNSHISKLYVIGNIPYAITADLLFYLYQNANILSQSVIMVQKEVAKRIVAKPRTKEYGILTIATELVGTAKILFDVQPGSFYPVPKVTSSVFSVEYYENQREYKEFRSILELVKSGFNQRRKKLVNALDNYVQKNYGIDIRTCNHPFLQGRAEELTTANFISLKQYFDTFVSNEKTL